ncbi:hypothetical protein ACHAXR_009651 [Thalassiosira sp. AJA248-18]
MLCSIKKNKSATPPTKSSRQLHLDGLPTVCFLLLSLLSSAHLAFLVGQKVRHALLSPVGVTPEQYPAKAAPLDMVDEMIQSAEKSARLPSGQHLFIDIQHVNANFLTSEHLLSEAIVAFVEEKQLAMLSYHCHPLEATTASGGVTCVGIMHDGHMSLHTWPNHGVIELDLFTSSSSGDDLIPMLPLIKRLFAIPTTTTTTSYDIESFTIRTNQEKPKFHWGHKLRGFRQGFLNYQRDKNPYDQELGQDILRRRDFDHKKLLVSTKTSYQHVDIYELLHPKGTAYAALGKKSPLSTTTTDDDETLSQQDGLNEYYKVGLDRALFIDGVLQSSLYGESAYHEALVHPALLSHPDPRRVAIITQFIESLYDGLTEDGIMVAQVGAIPQDSDPPDELSHFYNRAHMLNKLEEVGFQSIHVYDEGHCHFYTPWQFIVAFKDSRLRENWYRNSAEIDIELHQRLHRTKSGKPALRFFDGSTMMNYQTPPKVVESNHCRKGGTALECHDSSSEVKYRRSRSVVLAVEGSASNAVLNFHGMSDDELPTVALIEGGCNGTLTHVDLHKIPVYSPVSDRHIRVNSVCRDLSSYDMLSSYLASAGEHS